MNHFLYTWWQLDFKSGYNLPLNFSVHYEKKILQLTYLKNKLRVWKGTCPIYMFDILLLDLFFFFFYSKLTKFEQMVHQNMWYKHVSVIQFSCNFYCKPHFRFFVTKTLVNICWTYAIIKNQLHIFHEYSSCSPGQLESLRNSLKGYLCYSRTLSAVLFV